MDWGNRYPLVRSPDGKGYHEVADPEPGRLYSAYRETCADQFCPFSWPPGPHSHIIDEPVKWPAETHR